MQIGSEMAALQEKTPKMDPKKRFFWKIPQDFELLKKVPQNIHQTGQFGWNRYIGIWNLSHGAFQGDVDPKPPTHNVNSSNMPVMEYRGTYNQTKAYYYTKAGTLWLHSKKGRVEKCGNHTVHFGGLAGALLIESFLGFL